MDVGLALESDTSVESYAPVIRKINKIINDYFKNRNYGEDLQDLAIGIIFMEPGPSTNKFHPVRPFKYEKESSYKDIFTNKQVIIKNAASYDVKPNYARLAQMTLDEAHKYIVELLINSTDVLESNHVQFPNFDLKKFRKDFSDCLKAYTA